MTLFECIQSFLLSDSSLAAKVPGGFRPQIIPQGQTLFPVVVVRFISGASEPPTHDSGASPISRIRLEFTAYGNDFKTQEQIANQIANDFAPFNGYLGGSQNGRFATEMIQGPRTVQDQSTRLVGVQVDILGKLDSSTLS